ncbi:hypothetical protein [Chamaesiphon sp.]|uniref:hypothetical protein n=1 Tax=Chamaesiphon sp. TaxID=2814140 RepID=UPI003593844C
MSSLSTNLVSQNYFTAPASSESNLWQLETIARGNRAEISNIKAANTQLLHLLALNQCGKMTVTTPLQVLVS